MKVAVHEQDFDVNEEYQRLRENKQAGGISIFVGQVRDHNLNDGVQSLTLEHYPGMAEKMITDIVEQAKQHWEIFDATVIHRVGTLKPADQIVFVGVSSAHRGDAIHACEFIIDHLKSDVPFWKKEQTATDVRWLEPNPKDQDAKSKWD